MWRVFTLAAFLVPNVADLPDSMSAACRTPHGTLCRTIRFESSGWVNGAWGFHAVGRWRGTAVLSYRMDGGILERYSQRNYRNYFFNDGSWDRSQIRFAHEQQTIDIDHFSREYRVRPVFVGGSPVWHSGDADCSGMAARFLLTDLRTLGETMIAGVRSVGFLGRSRQGAPKEIWLAPSMGCSQMKVLESTFNSLGLPTSHSRIEVVNVEIGDPDPALFQNPLGHTRIP